MAQTNLWRRWFWYFQRSFRSPKLPLIILTLALCLLTILLQGDGHTPSTLSSGATRIIVVGDVHGCSEELGALLEALSFKRGHDELILLGDLIGKGPNPREVIQIARKHSAKAVQGNHEFNLLEWRRRGGPLPDPLGKIKASYAATVSSLQEEDWQWLAGLPFYLRLELPSAALPVVAVHAGLVPGVPLELQKPEVMVHLRSFETDGQPSEKFDAGSGAWAKTWAGPEQLIFGHDAKRGLQMERFALGLDTGVVYGGALTAVVLQRSLSGQALPPGQESFVSVPARREYSSKNKSG